MAAAFMDQAENMHFGLASAKFALLERSDLLHQTRLAPSCLILVDDALRSRLIKLLDGGSQICLGIIATVARRIDGGLNAGLDFRTNGLVYDPRLFVCLYSFDLTLDVGHLEKDPHSLCHLMRSSRPAEKRV